MLGFKVSVSLKFNNSVGSKKRLYLKCEKYCYIDIPMFLKDVGIPK